MREATKNYLEAPKVTVNGRVFVDKEYFKDKAILLINDEKKDATSQDERDGLEQAIIVLSNM